MATTNDDLMNVIHIVHNLSEYCDTGNTICLTVAQLTVETLIHDADIKCYANTVVTFMVENPVMEVKLSGKQYDVYNVRESTKYMILQVIYNLHLYLGNRDITLMKKTANFIQDHMNNGYEKMHCAAVALRITQLCCL